MGLATALHAGKWCEGSHFLCHLVWSVGLLPSVAISTLFDAAQRNIQGYNIEQRDIVLMRRGSMREISVRLSPFRVQHSYTCARTYTMAHLSTAARGRSGRDRLDRLVTSATARSRRCTLNTARGGVCCVYRAACCMLFGETPDTETTAHG
jgi:hypothetical protein